MNSLGLVCCSFMRPVTLLGLMISLGAATLAEAALLWEFRIVSPSESLSGTFLTDGDFSDLYGDGVYDFTITEFQNWSYNRTPVNFSRPPGPSFPSTGPEKTNLNSNSFTWTKGEGPSNPGSLASPLYLESHGDPTHGVEQGFSLLSAGIDSGGGEVSGFNAILYENVFGGPNISFSTTSMPTVIAPVPEPEGWVIVGGVACCWLFVRRSGSRVVGMVACLMLLLKRRWRKGFAGVVTRILLVVVTASYCGISNQLRAAAITVLNSGGEVLDFTDSKDRASDGIVGAPLIGPSVLSEGGIETALDVENPSFSDKNDLLPDEVSMETDIGEFFLSEPQRRDLPFRFVFAASREVIGSGFELLTIDVPIWLFEPVAFQYGSMQQGGGLPIVLCSLLGFVALVIVRFLAQRIPAFDGKYWVGRVASTFNDGGRSHLVDRRETLPYED